jgi:ABC-2 type transport system ATP-binding protein
MPPVIAVSNVSKTYASGFSALQNINLEIRRSEIFALLGPNGAGKTTLISIICGIVNLSTGRVLVDGHDIITDFRAARSLIGLVPQELATDAFETVWATVSFSRGLFGRPANPDLVASVLKSLSLWDKKDNKIMTLSGGMKRRVMIAKALAHEPQILFLDEPTAGVDVELRQALWHFIQRLNRDGHTIVLTTHYLEEAEALCNRIAMLKQGRMVALDSTSNLLRRVHHLFLRLRLDGDLPAQLHPLEHGGAAGGHLLKLKSYDDVEPALACIRNAGRRIEEMELTPPDLEDVFVDLMKKS